MSLRISRVCPILALGLVSAGGLGCSAEGVDSRRVTDPMGGGGAPGIAGAPGASGAGGSGAPVGNAAGAAGNEMPGIDAGVRGDPVDLGDAGDLSLVPWPTTVARTTGSIEILPSTRIVATSPSLAALAAVLSSEVQILTGLTLAPSTATPEKGDIVLGLDAGQTRLVYKLEVTDAARITGGSYAAVAQGTSTLLQLFFAKGSRFGVPRLTINDDPVPAYTGLMVDIARVLHTPDSLKQQIELCRLYRIEYLRWHMSDMEGWTFPSTKYPQLGSTNWGAFGLKAPKVFTRDELLDVVKFADDRGVSLIPEIDVPFHSGSITSSYPAVNWDGGHVHIAKDVTYTFLNDVIGEMADVFASSRYIHVGGDEFSIDFNKLKADSPQFMAAHNLTNLGDVIQYLESRLDEFVTQRGKKAMAWAPTTRANKDMAMNVWNSGDDPQKWLTMGFPVINTPDVPGWFETASYAYEDLSLFEKDGHPITDTNNPLFLGADQVYWERGEERTIQYLRDTAAAHAERTRNPFFTQTLAQFTTRFAKTDVMLDKLLFRFSASIEGLYERKKSEGKMDYRVPAGSSAKITLTPTVSGATIRYTLGNFTQDPKSALDPTATAQAYSAPITIPSGKMVQLRAALFDAAGQQLGMTFRSVFNGNLNSDRDGGW